MINLTWIPGEENFPKDFVLFQIVRHTFISNSMFSSNNEMLEISGLTILTTEYCLIPKNTFKRYISDKLPIANSFSGISGYFVR